MFNVALLGLGKAGRFHLKSILRSDRCKLRYVLETGDSIARAREVLSKVRSLDLEGTTRLVDKYEDVLSDPGVDAVVVATPTSTHEAYVRQALRAGKPVLCEKPLAETAESVRSCYDEAVRCGLPLHCGFNRRFDPDFSRVYRQLKDGLVGKPHLIKLTSRDGEFHDLSYFQHSGSASIFKDSCVHEIDQLHWMVGEGPTEVYAQGYAHHPKIKEMGDVDTAIAVLKFPSGVLATIDNGRFSAYGHDQRLEVYKVQRWGGRQGWDRRGRACALRQYFVVCSHMTFDCITTLDLSGQKVRLVCNATTTSTRGKVDTHKHTHTHTHTHTHKHTHTHTHTHTRTNTHTHTHTHTHNRSMETEAS